MLIKGFETYQFPSVVAPAEVVYGDKVDSNRYGTDDKRDYIAPAKEILMFTHYESREVLDALCKGPCRW